MKDRQIGMWFASAIALWVVTFLLVVGGGAVGLVSDGLGDGLGLSMIGVGLATSAAAATVSIKHMLCRYHGMLHDAFLMGRDFEHGDRSVRSLR